jgi:hypothetical protein
MNAGRRDQEKQYHRLVGFQADKAQLCADVIDWVANIFAPRSVLPWLIAPAEK